MTENKQLRGRRSSRSGHRATSSQQLSDVSTTVDNRQLLKATIVAVVIAAIVLVTAVLPAEYGIDPTGVGSALGLTAMAAATDDEITGTGGVQTAQQSAASADVVSKTEVAMRADSMSVTLQPGEGAEIKARMKAGERMVFEWVSTGGAVNFDMHGEEQNAGDKFTSYWADQQKESAAGVFVAPVDGTHGWFWRNRGDAPVEVTVQTSGFYEELFRAQ